MSRASTSIVAIIMAVAAMAIQPVPAEAQQRDTVQQGARGLTIPVATEVRTFQLKYLAPSVAQALVWPYASGAGQPMSGPPGVPVITVRASAENLRAIENLLAQYDVPPATITFRFQLIDATEEATPSDPRLAEVQPILQDLFRFRGYRLLSQTALMGSVGSRPSQTVGDPMDGLDLRLTIINANFRGDSGLVSIDVSLSRQSGMTSTGTPVRTTFLSTGLTIPIGHTVILGSAVVQSGPSGKAIILTVKPEVAPPVPR